MNHSKQTFVTAFALFSLFFGAGNLILPPYLGVQAGTSWLWVALGFAVSAVIIPILAIYGHARLQGTLTDFAKKLSPPLALVYALVIYAIAASLPSPRTASVTYEMAIAPYLEISSLLFSTLYFALVLVFVLNRSKLLELIGKFLTPLIILMLLLIIILGLSAETETAVTTLTAPFSVGILEGYQTFDAIGGVVVGGVIVVSFALQGKHSYEEKKRMIGRAGLMAGVGLFVIYAGLIALGSSYTDTFPGETRTELLTFLSVETLGPVGTTFLAVLVGLACFTTAVGIVTGTADFLKGVLGNSKMVFTITAVLACVIGVVVGQFNVGYIIDIAVPTLMIIYPLTIILILLNALPERWIPTPVFRAVVIVTIIFSIPEFLTTLLAEESIPDWFGYLPLFNQNLGWLLPATLTFLLAQFLRKNDRTTAAKS
ncbi:branched-chain amino acid transport system II carrier protein [Altibacter sp. HG106]|uniref:branched-chain amino acid transport system II carrier protein n=1 Tax=Altibacter sp. HG106 TaxID=3023937 RepID=UPI002350D282|nr:branched-chain amino acid transport system II carrier protein [Altibacter sp. HG106]MDC7995159.1 branched-chain amino acid transport system II carrier protein [Altibacter sp. HG106]